MKDSVTFYHYILKEALIYIFKLFWVADMFTVPLLYDSAAPFYTFQHLSEIVVVILFGLPATLLFVHFPPASEKTQSEEQIGHPCINRALHHKYTFHFYQCANFLSSALKTAACELKEIKFFTDSHAFSEWHIVKILEFKSCA